MSFAPFSILLGLALVPWLYAFETNPADLLRAGRFQEALNEIQTELKSQPHDARLLTMQGIALARMGHDQAALESYRGALSVAPEYLPALEGAAEIEFRTNDAEAVDRLNHLIGLNPKDGTAHAMRAVLGARAGRCEQAIADFAAAQDAIEKQPDAIRQYGACLFRLTRWNEAERAFEKLLAADPNDEQAAYGEAASQIEAGRFQEALATLKAFPHDAQALALSATALEALGRTPEATADLRSAIVADPRRESFYTQFAELCFTHQSYQAGIDVINAGLTQLPNSAKLYLARGVLLVQEGNYDGAEADFAKADTLDPKEAGSADAAVLALVQANRLDEANRALNEKLKQHPRDAQLFFFKADVLSREGDLKDSLTAAQKAVSLRPDFALAHDLLARLYLEAGDENKAIGECQLALKSNPEDETALYRWLRILKSHQAEADGSAIAELTDRWNKARGKQKEDELRDSRYRILTTLQK